MRLFDFFRIGQIIGNDDFEIHATERDCSVFVDGANLNKRIHVVSLLNDRRRNRISGLSETEIDILFDFGVCDFGNPLVLCFTIFGRAATLEHTGRDIEAESDDLEDQKRSQYKHKPFGNFIHDLYPLVDAGSSISVENTCILNQVSLQEKSFNLTSVIPVSYLRIVFIVA